MPHNVFRDGRVHVLREMCATCIFRPGNLMQLHAGRVREMVDEARSHESTIVCHSTLGTGAHAACRGFFDRYPTQPLQIAERLGLVQFIDPPNQGGPDMTDLTERFLYAASRDVDLAAALLAKGLMQGDVETYKAGYPREDALLSAFDIFPAADTHHVRSLLGVIEPETADAR